MTTPPKINRGIYLYRLQSVTTLLESDVLWPRLLKERTEKYYNRKAQLTLSNFAMHMVSRSDITSCRAVSGAELTKLERALPDRAARSTTGIPVLGVVSKHIGNNAAMFALRLSAHPSLVNDHDDIMQLLDPYVITKETEDNPAYQFYMNLGRIILPSYVTAEDIALQIKEKEWVPDRVDVGKYTVSSQTT